MEILGLNLISVSNAIESGIVLFALHQHVHVWLAHSDVVWVILEASKEVLVEAHAWVLLNLLLLGLSIVNWGHLLWCDLLLLDLSSVSWTTSHDSSDSLVSNFWTSTECHSSHYSSSKAAHHSTRLLRWSHLWSLVVHGWLWGMSCSSWWAWSSESTWSWRWSSS